MALVVHDLLALLNWKHCGHRVVATSRLIGQHFQGPAGYRNYPPLYSPLRYVGVRAALLRLL